MFQFVNFRALSKTAESAYFTNIYGTRGILQRSEKILHLDAFLSFGFLAVRIFAPTVPLLLAKARFYSLASFAGEKEVLRNPAE